MTTAEPRVTGYLIAGSTNEPRGTYAPYSGSRGKLASFVAYLTISSSRPTKGVLIFGLPSSRSISGEEGDVTDDQDQPDIFAFWGKAGRAKAGEEVVPLPLVCHLIDTAVVAELLFEVVLGPRCRAELAAAFGPLGNARRWVALLCALHDIGKLSPAFQALRPDIALRQLRGAARSDVDYLHRRAPSKGRTDTFHGVLTTIHIRRILTDWGAAEDVALRVALALGGHHGFFDSAASVQEAMDARNHHGGNRWAKWVDEMCRQVSASLGMSDPSFGPWSKVKLSSGAEIALAGLTTVSDWVASGLVIEPGQVDAQSDLVEYVRLSRIRASEALAKMDWARWQPPADIAFSALFDESPRPLQEAVEELIKRKKTAGILVVEAPTGEGKTKIALQCATAMVGTLGLSGFYLGMPTRATSNQAFAEIRELLGRLDERLPVKLLHGTAAEHLASERQALKDARAELLTIEDVGRDSPGGHQDLDAREWFTRLKGLLASLAVGTVDRILQAGIRSRFVPVSLIGLSNKVVIVDEVHAYDTYMSTLLDRLLWWLGRLDVPVILLSATLPSKRRDELICHWRAGATGLHPDEVKSPPTLYAYPRAMWADAHGYDEATAPVSQVNADRTVRLGRVAEDDLAPWIVAQAKQDQCVAVVHNLVRRADETYTAVSKAIEQIPERERPELIHITGQLSNATRARAEMRLRHLFGPEGVRPRRAIVIGTSVLEQSLDLDFDVMVSDLAPIDNLIQRLGRLHRFRKILMSPLLAITGVADTPGGPRFPAHTSRVYVHGPCSASEKNCGCRMRYRDSSTRCIATQTQCCARQAGRAVGSRRKRSWMGFSRLIRGRPPQCTFLRLRVLTNCES
jgi:CRISPR-associated endonuclease/helicase Cas3